MLWSYCTYTKVSLYCKHLVVNGYHYSALQVHCCQRLTLPSSHYCRRASASPYCRCLEFYICTLLFLSLWIKRYRVLSHILLQFKGGCPRTCYMLHRWHEIYRSAHVCLSGRCTRLFLWRRRGHQCKEDRQQRRRLFLSWDVKTEIPAHPPFRLFITPSTAAHALSKLWRSLKWALATWT